ncbi:TetR family transcriptional regulator [Alkalibaculum sporogenes]|uniref:TetR family transcriptional regulator n=1 Tax=Alkalibaculum sporogenes TaxID=2655001 RepID=UPI00187B283A
MKEIVVDDKQTLKKQRVKAYFHNATKEMIIIEGIESISIRKVAEKAGYSYTTLYNYFKDINELLWEVKLLMINDLVELKKDIVENENIKDGLKSLFGTYIRYFFEYPNIFKFFYFHKVTQPTKNDDDRKTEPNYEAMMMSVLNGFVLEGILKDKDIEVVGKTLIYSVHGLLTLYFSGNGDITEKSVYNDLNRIIDYLL